MSRHLLTTVALAAALSAGACDAVPGGEAPTTSGDAAPAAAASTPRAAPLTASGAPRPLTAAPEADDSLMSAASVVRVDPVGDSGAKLFGTAGGDPAMNGLATYIAFFTSPGDGWVIYSLGDILDYTVLSSSAGRVDLDLHESTMDEATGEIGSRHRKVIVSWTPGDDGAPPTGVTVTPAQ
ncbi:MAG: hypothetical protein K2X25_00865 [Caulobacteraceae bacterium]|nr:hypothetical protein [Caulobacteraceae bacterium]